MFNVNLGAAWDKYVNGNKAADVLPGYDVIGANNTNNGTGGWMPWINKEPTPAAPAKTTNPNLDPKNSVVQDPGTNVPAGSGAGAAAAGPARDLAAEGFYQSGIDQTNNLIGSLGTREQAAIQALIQSFQQGRERQDVALADNTADFTNTTDRLTRENANKKSQIDTRTGNNITALQRFLASKGAGSSSAATSAVPLAAAQEGTAQRSEASQTFTDNMDTTTTNFNRYKREADQAKLDAEADFENAKKDTSGQFAEQGISARQKLQELQTNLASARGGDAGAIAAARSITSQINELQNKIASLAARSQSRVIKADDPAYKPAETKAFADTTTDIAQKTPGAAGDPNFDSTAAYYADTKKLSDEDLLKQLYA